MGCFGGSKGGGVQQVPKLTPEQEKLVKVLGLSATPAIQGVTGATIPGQEFAPGGPSALQQQAFGLAQGMPEQFAFDPQRVAQNFGPVADFARQGFQQETIPAIAGAVGYGGGARSSGFQDILAREGRNLELGLAGQLGQQQQSSFEQAQNRQLGIPGQIAQMGGLQGGFPEAQRQYRLQQFMAGRPEVDPRLGFIGPALGTSAYDTAVQQGTAQTGLGTSLMGLGGSYLAGGGTLGGIGSAVGGAASALGGGLWSALSGIGGLI